MPRSTARLAAATATAATLALAAPALADPAVTGSPSGALVSLAATGLGTRQLDVLDLAGQPLSTLALRSSVPQPFRVRVTDTGVGQLTSATAGFTVSAVMNNLYLAGSPTAASIIPSSSVTVGFPLSGAQNALGDVSAAPRTLLSGAIAACTAIPTLLPALSLASLAYTTLCAAMGTGFTITDLPVTTATRTLTSQLQLPFVLGAQQSGAFTTADYTAGIGAGDTVRTHVAALPRTLLSGVPGLPAGLAGLLALVPTTPISATGSNAQASAADVIGVLLSPPATYAAPASPLASQLAALGTALGLLTPADATTVLSGLTASLQSLSLADISGVTGAYNAVPVLTATAPAGTPAGSYSGTMTVTLVQP